MEKKYTITKKMFPGFVILYEYANSAANNLDDEWKVIYGMINFNSKVAITYNEKERIILNQLRTKYIGDSVQTTLDGQVRHLVYYKDVKLPDISRKTFV